MSPSLLLFFPRESTSSIEALLSLMGDLMGVILFFFLLRGKWALGDLEFFKPGLQTA